MRSNAGIQNPLRKLRPQWDCHCSCQSEVALSETESAIIEEAEQEFSSDEDTKFKLRCTMKVLQAVLLIVVPTFCLQLLLETTDGGRRNR